MGIVIRRIGPFQVHTTSQPSETALLFTHGSFTELTDSTSEILGASLVIYAREGHPLLFKDGIAIVEGSANAPGANRIMGASCQPRNYHLAALRLKPTVTGFREYHNVLEAWRDRSMGADSWDWWTVLDEPTDMNTFLQTIQTHNYQTIQFVCCTMNLDFGVRVMELQDEGLKSAMDAYANRLQ